MADATVARRYAQAVFQLAAEQNAIAVVARDLAQIRDALYQDATARSFFLSPVIERAEKERLLRAAFSDKLNEIAINTVLLIVRKRREALLPEIVRQFDILELQARGADALTVTTAMDLTPHQLETVVARLESLYGRKFEVTELVNANLIGGLRIMMGDRRIDGSVEGRLEQLSRTLFAKTGAKE